MSRIAFVFMLLLVPSLSSGAEQLSGSSDSSAQGAKSKPKGSLSWFKAGVDLARQGEYKAALTRFKRARSMSPRWALPHLEIAVAHLRTDNNRKIIGDCLAKATKYGPEIPRARLLYGVFLQEGGKRREAIREFVQALKRRPSIIDARFRLATLYVEEGHQADGIEQYRQVLKQQPSHRGAHRNLAFLLEQSGQLEQAESHLKDIVRLDPTSAYSLTALGRFYERVGWADKAKKTFRKAQRLSPTGDRRKMRPLLKSRN